MSGTSSRTQPIAMRSGAYEDESGSSDGYVERFQNAMLRAVVPCARAIESRVSPALTT